MTPNQKLRKENALTAKKIKAWNKGQLIKGVTYYWIPSGADFVVPINVEEVQKEPNWTIECYWIDEPNGHALYEYEEYTYLTLAGALSGLRSKRKELAESKCPKWQKWRHRSLYGWRQKRLKGIMSGYPKGTKWPRYPKKKIYV